MISLTFGKLLMSVRKTVSLTAFCKVRPPPRRSRGDFEHAPDLGFDVTADQDAGGRSSGICPDT